MQKLGPYGIAVVLGAFFQLTGGSDSPRLPRSLTDREGSAWYAWGDFEKNCIHVQRKWGAFTNEPIVETLDISLENVRNLQV